MTRFDDRLAEELREQHLPSVAAALVHQDRIAWSGAIGTVDGRDGSPVSVASRYRIGSITKTFVAVEVLRLRDEGLLDLGDQLGQHLRDVPWPQVTLAQLLSHTSGLQAETNGPWWERTPGGSWADLLADPPRLVHTPGTRFHYSNVGFAVLGELVARLRGATWWEAVKDGIVDPLGLTATSPVPDGPAVPGWSRHPTEDLLMAEPFGHDAGAMAPAGQLWSTVGDLARWAMFVSGDCEPVLARSTLDEMRVPLAIDNRPDQPWLTAQGLGWRIWEGTDQRHRGYGHGGSMPGYLASLKAEPSTGLAVVVLCNETWRLGSLGDDLLALARSEWAPEGPDEITASGTIAEDVDALLGDWFWGPVPYRLAASADGFVLGDIAGHRRSRFVRDGDGWRGLDAYFAGERLVVRSDGSLDLASFVLSRTPYDPAVAHPGGLDSRRWH